MLKKIGLFTALNFLLVFAVSAQTPENTALANSSTPSLEEILVSAEKQTTNYQEAFRNLLAVETKTFETFDKNEQVKEKRVVESNFLVYQSSKNSNISFELRNVIKVDGKPIPDSQTKSDQFFAELSKTSTLKSELEKIQKAGSKYDKTLDVSGLTLYEGIILSKNLRPYFEYQLLGNESVNGTEVYVIAYRQTKLSPFIRINGKEADLNSPSLEFNVDIPGNFKKNNVFLQGKLWLDAKTFQIWREERELVIQAIEPLTFMETTFEYQPSNYEILVPKQISLINKEIKKQNGKFMAFSDLRINFDYSQFRRTETDVKILDDEP